MSSANEASDSRRAVVRVGVLAAATVLLLALSFPPAGLDLLAWVALVPLLIALRRPPCRTGWLLLWLAGWAFGCVGFIWVRHVTVLGVALLGLYISFYFVGFCAVVRFLCSRGGVPLAVAAPVVWTALECVRGVFLSGLPWLLLSHTQYRNVTTVQIADLTGATGVTFWIVAVNGALAELVWFLGRWEPRAPLSHVVLAAVLAPVICLGGYAYGRHRLATIPVRTGPSIALVQGNIPQEVKNEAQTRLEDFGEMLDRYIALTKQALDEGRPDLVIWPETMAPPGMFDAQYDAICRASLPILLREHRLDDYQRLDRDLRLYDVWRARLEPIRARVDLLISATSFLVRDDDFYCCNSAYYLPRGGGEPTDRYDKIHLVPFGEYLPLRPLIGWFTERLVPFKRDLTPGTRLVRFTVKDWSFAPTICFEDAFPELVAEFARTGRKPDFIVNVTNEGWFRDGAELDEHLAIAVYRAVECRAGFVRAANTGISAFIAPTGRIVSRLEVGGKDREVAGVLLGVAMTTDARPPYLVLGELFGRLCAAACLVLILLAAAPQVVRRIRARRGARGAGTPR